MSVIQATTPELVFSIPADLTDKAVEIVLKQRNRTMQFANEMVAFSNDRLRIVSGASSSTVYLALTQEETISLCPGTCQIQGRIMDSSGYVQAVDFGGGIDVGAYLRPAVLTYGEEGSV